MKRLLYVIILISAVLPSGKTSAHAAHANHNMILLGTEEVFATHIVYLVPHNVQVILKLQLPAAAKSVYLLERKSHPEEQFRFVLKQLDLSHIQELTEITGMLVRVSADGKKTVLMDAVVLSREQFKVLFFDELPLSLAADAS